MKPGSKTRTQESCCVAAAVLVLLATAPASAQIYRCIDEGTTVFSDIPCSESAEPYLAENRISVVEKAEGLDEVAAGNRKFLEQRREQLAKNRERSDQRRAREQLIENFRLENELQPHYRTVVAAPNRLPRLEANPVRRLAPRTRALRDSEDEPERRRTLLSRSGGNQRNIIR